MAKKQNGQEEIEEVEVLEEQEAQETTTKSTKLAKAKAKAAEVKKSSTAKTVGVILLALGAGAVGYLTGKKKEAARAAKDEELEIVDAEDNDYDETEAE